MIPNARPLLDSDAIDTAIAQATIESAAVWEKALESFAPFAAPGTTGLSSSPPGAAVVVTNIPDDDPQKSTVDWSWTPALRRALRAALAAALGRFLSHDHGVALAAVAALARDAIARSVQDPRNHLCLATSERATEEELSIGLLIVHNELVKKRRIVQGHPNSAASLDKNIGAFRATITAHQSVPCSCALVTDVIMMLVDAELVAAADLLTSMAALRRERSAPAEDASLGTAGLWAVARPKGPAL